MSVLLQEKKDECSRVIQNISVSLGENLATHLGLTGLQSSDFLQLLHLIKDNYAQIQPHLQAVFLYRDVLQCIKARNTLYHQEQTTIEFLNRSLHALRACQAAFGIQSALVPLRILACRRCNTFITRTAQPTVRFKDATTNTRFRTTRTYDVQSWTTANDRYEDCKRDTPSWYDGWIWHTAFCATCRNTGVLTEIGRRYDWAPEDRIDLTQCTVRYILDKQATIVHYPDNTVRDLTHVVSDGKVRRHFYCLYESMLQTVT